MLDVREALFGDSEADPDAGKFESELAERRSQLFCGVDRDDRDAVWNRRRFPVISVLAPAVSTAENKVEYPGDPMCVYHALSKSIADAISVYDVGLTAANVFNDYCPFWSRYPDETYRRNATSCGVRTRTELEHCAADAHVFDPRVWNGMVEDFFRLLLRDVQPRVVLVSTVSPAYRYASVILRIVREELPGAITILGGRHIDATVIGFDKSVGVQVTESNPIVDIAKGVIEPCIDLMLAGECYFTLSTVLQAVALAIPVTSELGYPERKRLTHWLKACVRRSEIRGRSIVLLATENGNYEAFRLFGSPIDQQQLPSPYAAFAIRARFPIFSKLDGSVKLTAHIITGAICPFTCEFCSESRNLQKRVPGPYSDVCFALTETKRVVSYGAEAIFFDDSIFFSGSSRRIMQFCEGVLDQRKKRDGFEWGAQFTISVVEAFIDGGCDEAVLQSMADAGCTYIYFGIESLSTTIMSRISKTSRKANSEWPSRVRRVLETVRRARIRAGSAVLFGLEGESVTTIEETILGVEQLLRDELLATVSPNLMTYHPGTELTRRHDRENRLALENATLGEFVREPYSFFEEAFPGMVSRDLSEEMIWYIHRETKRRWGTGRYSELMPKLQLPDC